MISVIFSIITLQTNFFDTLFLAISFALALTVIMRGGDSTICVQLSSPAKAASRTAVASLIIDSLAVGPGSLQNSEQNSSWGFDSKF